MDAATDIHPWLVFAVVLLGFYLYKGISKPLDFPPGPTPLPFIGNLHNISKKGLHITAIKLGQKYGDIIGLKLNQQPTVVLNSLKLIREAFIEKSDIFSSRPDLHRFFTLKTFIWRNGKLTGVVWNNGSTWKSLRCFALMSLRDFGVGRKTIEQRIQDEVQAVSDVLQETSGKAYDMKTIFHKAVSNIICSVVFGSRYEYSDIKFNELMHGLSVFARNFSFSGILNIFPLLRYLPCFQWFWEAEKYRVNIENHINDQIEEHRDTLDHGSIRDFIDNYLVKEAEGHSKMDTFCKENMIRLITELFQAGTETTSTTLQWSFLYLIHNPEVQKKCQQEIDSLTGNSRQVSLADREHLAFVYATIHEIQRLSTIAPLSLPHTCDKDTILGGYHIPKGCTVLPNIYAVHHNDDNFEDAETFNPERWLSKDGKFQKNPAFMVFSTGARSCLGEVLAKAELFLFFSNLLQRFTFKPTNPTQMPTLERRGKAISSPQSYEMIAISRD